MRVLLLGSTGYLGAWLLAALRARGCTPVCAGRGAGDLHVDLADPAAVAAAVREARADMVLNAAAVALVGECEREPERAMAVNGVAPGILARAAPRVLQVSTDLVFDGVGAPYGADAEPRPLSAYGRSKRAGELAVLAAGPAHLVARVPLLFGRSRDGQRGATDMLRAAEAAGAEVVLFADEYRTPLHAGDAAEALVALLLAPGRRGIVHLAGPERLSRAELGRRFVALHGLGAVRIRVATSQDPLRPRDASLIADVPARRSLDEMLRDA